jgi:hypothetical protein
LFASFQLLPGSFFLSQLKQAFQTLADSWAVERKQRVEMISQLKSNVMAELPVRVAWIRFCSSRQSPLFSTSKPRNRISSICSRTPAVSNSSTKPQGSVTTCTHRYVGARLFPLASRISGWGGRF